VLSTSSALSRPRPLLALALVLGVVASALTACWPSVGTDFGAPGPYEVSVREDAEHWYYYPTDLGDAPRPHPVVLWGNGTWVRPEHYDALLRHLASHGFIVAAAYTSNAGSGREMLAGLDNLTAFNRDPESPFYRNVDVGTVATMGHSQGGGGAIEAGRDPRVDVVVPIEPWQGNVSGLHGPTFFLSGQEDTVIPPATVRQKYDASSSRIPAAYGEVAGADHIVSPLVDGHEFRAPITAWLRWHLLVDVEAKRQFVGSNCTYCSSSVFSEYVANDRLQNLSW
jgi:chlorophyllase-like protein